MATEGPGMLRLNFLFPPGDVELWRVWCGWTCDDGYGVFGLRRSGGCDVAWDIVEVTVV